MMVPKSARAGDLRPRADPDGRIVRLSGGDLMQWRADVGPVPQHIAGLLHLGPTTVTAAELVDHLSSPARQRGIPGPIPGEAAVRGRQSDLARRRRTRSETMSASSPRSGTPTS